jgi:hypothetical protein
MSTRWRGSSKAVHLDDNRRINQLTALPRSINRGCRRPMSCNVKRESAGIERPFSGRLLSLRFGMAGTPTDPTMLPSA